MMKFEALGHAVTKPSRALETFPAPKHVSRITFTSNELTTFCPVTHQPDFNTIKIEYQPNQKCIESKSLKLYLWSYRDEPAFCEALTAQIAQDIFAATEPQWCRVTITQNVRGGIKLEAVVELPATHALNREGPL
jgi:7-cyano-7-deazaguanine reductase